MDYAHHIKIGRAGLNVKSMPTPVDASQFYVCVECSAKMMFRTTPCVRRCGDAYVCSEACGTMRLNKLMEVDPLLTSPTSWSLIDCDASFNSDIISNNDSNVKSHTVQNTFSLEQIKSACSQEAHYVNESVKNLDGRQRDDICDSDFIFMDISSATGYSEREFVLSNAKQITMDRIEKIGCSRCIVYGASLFCMACFMIISFAK